VGTVDCDNGSSNKQGMNTMNEVGSRVSSLWLTITLLAAAAARGGEVSVQTDSTTGWQIYTLRQNRMVVQVVPQTGCNVFSIQMDGVQYLRVPEQLSQLPGVGYGNPILYPTPNRVAAAQFTFGGKTYKFPPNNGENFIHGLVHSATWKTIGTDSGANAASVHCELAFEPGTKHYQLFPFAHVVQLLIRVEETAVRWTYEIDNRQGHTAVPFGIGFHPYFVYQGQRSQTFLEVPATHVMEAVELLPTGKLLELGKTKYDLRQPTPLEGLMLDDVYFGMTRERPAVIDFRDAKRKITLAASDDFTHMVVYTPEQPFFCVENQTCSTDAHNLHKRGMSDVAHLRVCQPGMVMSGWVEYRFGSYH
jgi:aldose 1-epimerase